MPDDGYRSVFDLLQISLAALEEDKDYQCSGEEFQGGEAQDKRDKIQRWAGGIGDGLLAAEGT